MINVRYNAVLLYSPCCFLGHLFCQFCFTPSIEICHWRAKYRCDVCAMSVPKKNQQILLWQLSVLMRTQAQIVAYRSTYQEFNPPPFLVSMFILEQWLAQPTMKCYTTITLNTKWSGPWFCSGNKGARLAMSNTYRSVLLSVILTNGSCSGPNLIYESERNVVSGHCKYQIVKK